MIDYSLAQYTSSVMGNFLAAVAIFFSIVTAYVIAAFVGGSRLTKLQLVIVNISFTIAAGIFGTLSVLIYSRFVELGRRLQDDDGVPIVDYSLPLGILVAIVFLGCLVFMWSVRRDSK